MRALKPYIAAGNMPGVRVETGTSKTVAHVAAMDAEKYGINAANEKAAAITAYKAAVREAASPLAKHPEVRDAIEKVNVARRQERYTQGVLTGGRGTTVPLKPDEADRMWRYVNATADARQALIDTKNRIKAERIAEKQRTSSILAAKTDQLKDAKAAIKDTKGDKGRSSRPGNVVADTQRQVGHSNGAPTYAVRMVPPSEIERHMAQNGVDPAAYVNQSAPRPIGFRAWASKYAFSRGGGKGPSYTGQGLLAGATEPGYRALSMSQLGSLAKLQKAEAHDRFVSTFAKRDANGDIQRYSKNEVQQAIADAKAQPHGIDWAPILTHPTSYKGVQAEKVVELQNRAGSDELGQRLVTPQQLANDEHPNLQNIALVPKAAIGREGGLMATGKLPRGYLGHMQIDAMGSGGMAAVNRTFRNSVLPFSTKWWVEHSAEAGLRSLLVGAGPRDWQLTGKVLQSMRDQGLHDAADRLESTFVGMHFGMGHHANMEAIGMPALHNDSGVIRAAMNAHPAIQQIHDGYMHLIQGIYSANRQIGLNAEKAVLGSHMAQQAREMFGNMQHATHLQQQYIDELARGYSNPALAADAGRYIHETLGQYSRFSPGYRAYIRNVAPFAPWYWNSLRFIYHTLPIKHPIVAAVSLDANRVNQDQWAAAHKSPGEKFFGMPFGALASDIKTSPTGFVDIGRYTPAGAFTSGPLNWAASQISPVAQGSVYALMGLDPFGNTLKDAHGRPIKDTGTRAALAINQLASGLTGPTPVIERAALSGGRSQAAGSTLVNPEFKPNSSHNGGGLLGGLERTFWPFYPTYLRSQPALGPLKITGATIKGPSIKGVKITGVKIP
jgi:hypothetical protein